MRIVSLNAWGGAMFDELAPWLARGDADVVCLQEMTCTPGSDGWATFADGARWLPQRANLFDDVRSLLPRHQAMFVASDAGPVVDDSGREFQQQFGLGLFVSEQYPVVGAHASFVHGEFAVHDVWPHSGRPRIAQAVRLADPAAGRSVAIVHLHGLRDSSGKGDSPQRRAQAAKLAALVTSAGAGADLIVVCGDLNLLPDSETFQTLGAIGLVDLVRDSDTRTSRYRKPVRHASYALVSDPAAVRGFEIISEPEVSDHRPIAIEV